MTSNELFRGLLAAVAERKQELTGDHHAIHRAFFQVLQEVHKPGVQEQLAIEDLIEIDFDPLYGQSGWFDRALTRAQRDQIVSFPNPSYDRITISYDESARKAILTKLGSVPIFRQLADVFVSQLERSNATS